jgi:hypothetical protein
VNAHELATFARQLQDIRSRYEYAAKQLVADRAGALGLDPVNIPPDFERDVILEAQVRQYLLDPILEALGWDPALPNQVVVEDGVEANAESPSSHRRFLDYHGRDCESGKSFVIVEAKRPSVALPSDDIAEHVAAIIAELLAVNLEVARVARSPLPTDWVERLATLIDYARRVRDQTASPPVVVVLTNGDWFVIFLDAAATLLAEKPDVAKICVLKSFGEVLRRYKEVFSWLSFGALSGRIPPQRPAALGEFVPPGQEATCAHVVDVSYGQHGEEQPYISLRVAMRVLSSRGTWILFYKEYGEDFIMLSSEEKDLAQKRTQLERRVTELVTDLSQRHRLRFMSATEFERGYDARSGVANYASGNSPLALRITAPGAVRFRMTLGEATLYVTTESGFDACPYHYWAACSDSGDAQLNRPIMAPSTDPPVFFPNGSPLHCAHVAVHTRRRNKCLLLDFEGFLCCRRCAYFNRCWGEAPDQLPCRAG